MNRNTLDPILLVVLSLSIAACQKSAPVDPPASKNPAASVSKTKAGSPIDFVSQVKPILRDRCVMCHNKEIMPERHSFETRALTMKGDKKGPIIIPGNPESSRLILAVNAPKVHEQAMPPVSLRVTKQEIATLSQWIREGASWPGGKAGLIIPRNLPLE